MLKNIYCGCGIVDCLHECVNSVVLINVLLYCIEAYQADGFILVVCIVPSIIASYYLVPFPDY